MPCDFTRVDSPSKKNLIQNRSQFLPILSFLSVSLTLYVSTHIMVKHTQVIRRQDQTSCLSVFDHFCGVTT